MSGLCDECGWYGWVHLFPISWSLVTCCIMWLRAMSLCFPACLLWRHSFSSWLTSCLLGSVCFPSQSCRVVCVSPTSPTSLFTLSLEPLLCFWIRPQPVPLVFVARLLCLQSAFFFLLESGLEFLLCVSTLVFYNWVLLWVCQKGLASSYLTQLSSQSRMHVVCFSS